MAKKLAHIHPGPTLILSLLATIFIGAMLLLLPMARKESMTIIDILFTSTSATCVCGLLTIPVDKFTDFGHTIIFFLMQIGGLGLITMALFMMSLFVDFGLSTKLMIGQLLEIEEMKHVKRILVFIFSMTFICEAIGALIIYSVIHNQYSTWRGVSLSIFHAVSAFCNAGITLFPRGMQGFSDSPTMLITTASLILIGGLGFITWYEIFGKMGFAHKRRKPTLSVHSRLILSITLILTIVGTAMIWILEHNNTLQHQTLIMSIINAFFNAVSLRSTGFISVNFLQLQMATVFLVMIMAFIGSSPGSTGSGIKTSTFAVLFATAKSLLCGRTEVEIKGRRIPRASVYRAVTIVFIGLTWTLTTCFCLLISENNWRFLDILFESFSSFATLGVSSGLTPYLGIFGKILIMLSMIIGRIGTLTIALLLLKSPDKKKDFEYPEGRIMFS